MNNKNFTHEDGMNFLNTIITLIYNFVKTLKKRDGK